MHALEGSLLDPARFACLAEPVPVRLAAGVAGLLNSDGGYVLVGVQAEEGTGRVSAVPGLLPEFKPEIITEALRIIDPAPDALVEHRDVYLREGTHRVTVIAVRRSPQAPHVVTRTGLIHYWTREGLQTATTRRELDHIYERGRDSRERVQQVIDAMVEKVSLSHFAFMGFVAIVATSRPTAVPFLWAREHVHEVLDPSDPFVERWRFNEAAVQVRPGEMEVHTGHETSGFIRVTRSGSIAVGEVDRRPYHGELGTPAEVRERLVRLFRTARRVTVAQYTGDVLPIVLLEGVRNLALTGEGPDGGSAALKEDTVRIACAEGPLATDGDVERVVDEAVSGILDAFRAAAGQGA
jgi:hypothetical protein